MLCILFPVKYIAVDLSSNRITGAIRFMTSFPEVYTCKTIYIIGRPYPLALLSQYTKNKMYEEKLKGIACYVLILKVYV